MQVKLSLLVLQQHKIWTCFELCLTWRTDLMKNRHLDMVGIHIFLLYQLSTIDKNILTVLLLNTTCPILPNSVDPDQLASLKKPTDLDLHCFQISWLL